MIGTLLQVLSWVCLVAGLAFALIAAIGMLRFPDVFSRSHAAGIADTVGAGLILLGLGLQAPSWLVAVKLLLIFAFIVFTTPTATHALARAALSGGLKPMLGRVAGAARTGEPPSRR
jgi:multicomponent Na+:H+ antiporter subunit G